MPLLKHDAQLKKSKQPIRRGKKKTKFIKKEKSCPRKKKVKKKKKITSS